jgi:hypothetical protein
VERRRLAQMGYSRRTPGSALRFGAFDNLARLAMAFPFAYGSQLRQQLLIAIGSTGLLSAGALSCTTTHPPIAQTAGTGAGQTAGSAGVGSAGTPSCSSGGTQRDCFTQAQMMSSAKFGCGMIAIMPTPSDDEAQAKFAANGCLMRAATCDSCCNPALAEGEPQADGSCCYAFCSGACCGRPFIVEGEARLAGVMRRSDWLGDRVWETATFPPLSTRIGSEWLQDARMEHASIASFARFTLDLLAYGAPAELVEAAQRAALDEVEHARACFGLAARYSALDRGPAPLSAAGVQVAASLWDAALAAFHEGCVAETVAALQARASLERARDPEVLRALTRIADDEARHAELAWRFVAWAMQRLGAPFSAELSRQLAALLNVPAPVSVDGESAELRAALHAAGRLTSLDKQRLEHVAVHEVIAPCVAALVQCPSPSAAGQELWVPC